jgi:hypothetical protein
VIAIELKGTCEASLTKSINGMSLGMSANIASLHEYYRM